MVESARIHGRRVKALNHSLRQIHALAERYETLIESRRIGAWIMTRTRTRQGATMDAIASDRIECEIRSLHRKGMSVRRTQTQDAPSWLGFLQALDQDTRFS